MTVRLQDGALFMETSRTIGIVTYSLSMDRRARNPLRNGGQRLSVCAELMSFGWAIWGALKSFAT
jgi:hypothetical protein